MDEIAELVDAFISLNLNAISDGMEVLFYEGILLIYCPNF